MTDKFEDRFNDIVTRVAAGEGLDNDDALLVLQVVRNLDQNLSLADTILTVTSEILPAAYNRFGVDVLRRAGRTDAKIKKSVAKLADQHAALFWAQLRQTAVTLDEQNDAPTVDTDTTEDTE